MSNKELAVQLYCAYLQASVLVVPKSKEIAELPTNIEMVESIKELVGLLVEVESE